MRALLGSLQLGITAQRRHIFSLGFQFVRLAEPRIGSSVIAGIALNDTKHIAGFSLIRVELQRSPGQGSPLLPVSGGACLRSLFYTAGLLSTSSTPML